MAVRRFVVPVTVDADGDAEEYSPRIYGHLVSFRYVKPGTGGYADGVDFVITGETSAATLWSEENVNASATRYPRGPTHSTAGVAALYAGAGTAVNDRITLSGERVKIVVAAGGVSATGSFHITIDG
jgi:hypothetical protein